MFGTLGSQRMVWDPESSGCKSSPDTVVLLGRASREGRAPPNTALAHPAKEACVGHPARFLGKASRRLGLGGDTFPAKRGLFAQSGSGGELLPPVPPTGLAGTVTSAAPPPAPRPPHPPIRLTEVAAAPPPARRSRSTGCPGRRLCCG